MMRNKLPIRDALYRLFAFRARSEREVRGYLTRKRVEPEKIAELITEFKNQGFINDLEFAKNWIDARRRNKFKSDRAIFAELMQKGVSKEIIQEGFTLSAGLVSQEDLAIKLIEKKLNSWQNLPPEKFKLKIYTTLLQRGFEYSVVKLTVAKFVEKK